MNASTESQETAKELPKRGGIVTILRVFAVLTVLGTFLRVPYAENPLGLLIILASGIFAAAIVWGFAAAIQALREIEFNTRR